MKSTGGLHPGQWRGIPVPTLGKCHWLVYRSLLCACCLACICSWGTIPNLIAELTWFLSCIYFCSHKIWNQVVRVVKREAQPSFLFLPDCTWRNDCTNMAIRFELMFTFGEGKLMCETYSGLASPRVVCLQITRWGVNFYWIALSKQFQNIKLD